MARTSDEECPHCQEIIRVPLDDYVDGKLISCPHCRKESHLRKVPSPTGRDLQAKVWHLRPSN